LNDEYQQELARKEAKEQLAKQKQQQAAQRLRPEKVGEYSP
jgi:hypothetical protein